jgi:hypothetical protein
MGDELGVLCENVRHGMICLAICYYTLCVYIMNS